RRHETRCAAVKRLLLMMTLLAMMAASACTLGTAQEAREDSLNATQTALPLATLLVVTEAAGEAGTSGSGVQLTPLVTRQATPVLQPNSEGSCEGRLRVDVGTDPGNTLRLREQPNNSSTIVLLIPNSTIVYRVPGALDVNAGGYNWVNIQYTDPNGVQAVGWAARDA
ncbi:hypothetical protein B7486_79075, partial [cyanobacterium TDX16]